MSSQSITFRLVAAALVVLTLTAGAQAMITGYLEFFMVKNQTGQEANDFEVTIHGVEPEDISDVQTHAAPSPYYTDYEKIDNGDGSVTIKWTGSTTAAMGDGYFGFKINGDVGSWSGGDMAWTLDGQVIGTLPDLEASWEWLIEQSAAQATVKNNEPTPLPVYRREKQIQGEIFVSTLRANADFYWNSGDLSGPITLQSGQTAVSMLTPDQYPETKIFMYESGPLKRWSGAIVVPEPATLGLLALGACLPLFRRKRR